MRFIVTIPDRLLDEAYPDFGEQQVCDEIRDTLLQEMGGSYKDITVVADASGMTLNIAPSKSQKKRRLTQSSD